MSKISLLTIHWGMSYGAVLQAYATCKLLECKQHDVSVVNLQPISTKRRHSYFRLLLLSFTCFQFWLFKKKYFPNMTRQMRCVKSRLLSKSDYIVVGSDQVWNPNITSSISYSFFVDFDSNTTRVSLSSSFGENEWNENIDKTKKIGNYLKQFKAISVREESGAQIIKEKFGLDATVLIDPTLAYGNFDDLVLNHNEIPEIYTFFVSHNSENTDIAKHIANDLQIGIFKLSKFSYYTKNSPRHWLTYIKNSSCVITDSFHGVVFSIIFKKDFYVLCSEYKKFTRIDNLLNLLGLRERVVESIADYEYRKHQLRECVDYRRVDCILESERQRYNAFIDEHIK